MNFFFFQRQLVALFVMCCWWCIVFLLIVGSVWVPFATDIFERTCILVALLEQVFQLRRRSMLQLIASWYYNCFMSLICFLVKGLFALTEQQFLSCATLLLLHQCPSYWCCFTRFQFPNLSFVMLEFFHVEVLRESLCSKHTPIWHMSNVLSSHAAHNQPLKLFWKNNLRSVTCKPVNVFGATDELSPSRVTFVNIISSLIRIFRLTNVDDQR